MNSLYTTHTRNKFDNQTTKMSISDLTKVLKYKLDPTYTEICHPCFPTEAGCISKQGISYNNNKSIIDIESDLFNIGQKLVKDPSTKHKSDCINNCSMKYDKCDKCKKNNLFHFPSCEMKSENSRLFNPVSNLKIININRFLPLSQCLDIQNIKNIDYVDNTMINNRLLSKDNHKTVYKIPINQTDCLPKPSIDIRCNMYKSYCVNPIISLNKNYQLINNSK
jgi:hypothetical protein